MQQPVEEVVDIPVDAPILPDSYSHRPDVEKKLLDLLVGKVSCRGSCISAHGMVCVHPGAHDVRYIILLFVHRVGLVKLVSPLQLSGPMWLCDPSSAMGLPGSEW